ncbi:MAG: site-2 protease family protein [Phycisphaerales bacterium]|nr:site-2 protease family protein [Phycisphaerales bacterium]
MGGWWISDLLNDPNINGKVWVVSWAVWVILSICLHELAHGWTAVRLGDDTPILSGHMTWNPIVHMGPFPLIMFLLIGIAWGAMPVNPSRLRGKHGDTIVTIAGPAMNLLLAILATLLLILWVPLAQGQLISSVTVSNPLAANMQTFLALGAMLNVVLMIFNLLPIPPLDGGRIAVNFIPPYRRMLQSETGRWVLLGAFVLIFMYAGGIMFGIGMLSVDLVSQGVWAAFFPNMDAPVSLLPILN